MAIADGIAAGREIAMEEIEHRQPDGTVLLLRSFGKGSSRKGVLLLPDVGESLLDRAYDALAREIAAQGCAVYMAELRGHTLSQGKWSLHAHRVDIVHLVAHVARMHQEFFIVASGISASTMLEYDSQAHTFRAQMPPLPSGMLLLSPMFAGAQLLPKIPSPAHALKKAMPRLHASVLLRALQGNDGAFGRCRIDRESVRVFWDELHAYRLAPVRIQTPSAMLVPMDTHAAPLKRVFGSVRLVRADWLRSSGSAAGKGVSAHTAELAELFASLLAAERPIRFRNVR